CLLVFFFQAEDGIRDFHVTGVQTCALPISAMGWEEFLAVLGGIVAAAVGLLAPDRFATWVVGDLRDSRGYLRRLPARVDIMHEAAGARLVNDTVIASPLGGKYGVIWRSWAPTRSATRIHSHAHTYVKGDRRRATATLHPEK